MSDHNTPIFFFLNLRSPSALLRSGDFSDLRLLIHLRCDRSQERRSWRFDFVNLGFLKIGSTVFRSFFNNTIGFLTASHAKFLCLCCNRQIRIQSIKTAGFHILGHWPTRMQGGRGGRGNFFGFGDPFAVFGGFGGHGSLISSVFGRRDPFDDPFFAWGKSI